MDAVYLKTYIIIQLVIDLIFIVGVLFFLLRVRKDLEYKIVTQSFSSLKKIIFPFLSEAKKVSEEFDFQVKEKRKIVKQLNETMEAKITSLNFMISRADAIVNTMSVKENLNEEQHLENAEEKIITLYEKGYSNSEISEITGVTEGEVSIIVSLRQKIDSLSS